MKRSANKAMAVRAVLIFSLLTIFCLLFTAPSAQAACTQAMATSFKQEILAGTHTSGNTYKIALYNSASATLGASTTAYTATGEVSGAGYTAGGATLTGFATGSSGTTAWVDFTSDPSWANSTITADCALIYNSSVSNKAVAVFTFTSTSSTNGTFTITLPTPDASNALLRLQ